MATQSGTGTGVRNIAEELKARGFVEHEGGGEAAEFLATKRKVYHGIDPTAESLHVGHLVPIMLMKHLADAGHETVFVVGGGTGMIGDPRESGERVLLDAATMKRNTKAIRTQLATILGGRPKIFNNLDWLGKVSLIEFLRDTGKHFTVNQLVKREIIKKRLDAEDALSYTEFSYSLLQGYDFWYLYKSYGVDMQVGGSDQWANIISGIELVRRREGGTAYGLTLPIIADEKSGKKYGKSEGNAIWLDAQKTSSYSFYQFWINISDESLSKFLNIFTLLPQAEIATVLAEHTKNPSARVGQKKLAHEVTAMIHGEKAASAAGRVSEIFFGGSFTDISATDLAFIRKEVPMSKVSDGTPLTAVLVDAGLVESKGEARRLIEQKGISLNDVTVEDVNRALERNDYVGGIARLRRGKKIALVTRVG